MPGIERNGQQLGSIRVDEPKPKTPKPKAADVVVEDAPAKSTTTTVKKADTK